MSKAFFSFYSVGFSSPPPPPFSILNAVLRGLAHSQTLFYYTISSRALHYPLNKYLFALPKQSSVIRTFFYAVWNAYITITYTIPRAQRTLSHSNHLARVCARSHLHPARLNDECTMNDGSHSVADRLGLAIEWN